MRILAGQVVLLTGASGGLGTYIAQAFAERKVKLAMVTHPGIDLDGLHKSLGSNGSQCIALAADLREPLERSRLLDAVRSKLGPIDILVNNAGVEHNLAYHELSEDLVYDVLRVNLEAPMILSKSVLPDMLSRQQGHIVNVASLAGKSGPAFQEPYSATKAGLIAFTQSLRATYRGTGVSASVIVPAFTEAGIYARLKVRSGCAAPWLLTGTSAQQVARAVLRSIEQDAPEIIVNRYPLRPFLAISALAPRLGEWISTRIGVHDFFRRVAESEKRNPP